MITLTIYCDHSITNRKLLKWSPPGFLLHGHVLPPWKALYLDWKFVGN
jgi:hypothetical protein